MKRLKMPASSRLAGISNHCHGSMCAPANTLKPVVPALPCRTRQGRTGHGSRRHAAQAMRAMPAENAMSDKWNAMSGKWNAMSGKVHAGAGALRWSGCWLWLPKEGMQVHACKCRPAAGGACPAAAMRHEHAESASTSSANTSESAACGQCSAGKATACHRMPPHATFATACVVPEHKACVAWLHVEHKHCKLEVEGASQQRVHHTGHARATSCTHETLFVVQAVLVGCALAAAAVPAGFAHRA